MRHNLIDRLKEEWAQLDPVDPLRGLISDAIDALALRKIAIQSRNDVKPLTDERIKAIYAEQTGFDLDASPEALMDFARAIEAAHGVKGDA